MGLIELLTVLVVIGFLLWLLNRAPIDPTIRTIIWGVAILVVVLWLVRLFVGDIPIPRLR